MTLRKITCDVGHSCTLPTTRRWLPSTPGITIENTYLAECRFAFCVIVALKNLSHHARTVFWFCTISFLPKYQSSTLLLGHWNPHRPLSLSIFSFLYMFSRCREDETSSIRQDKWRWRSHGHNRRQVPCYSFCWQVHCKPYSVKLKIKIICTLHHKFMMQDSIF